MTGVQYALSVQAMVVATTGTHRPATAQTVAILTFNTACSPSGTAFGLPITCNILAQSTEKTTNGAPIDFSRGTVLGLSNPLTLSGPLPNYPVRISVYI